MVIVLVLAFSISTKKRMALEGKMAGSGGRDDGRDGCAEEEDIGRAFRYDHSALP